jgi:general stress protein YciG
MNPKESGRKGGLATRDSHLMLCPSCGNPIKSCFFEETGRKGGEATSKRYGRRFYSEIGHLGGRGNKRNGRGGAIPSLPGVKIE